jgi:hypothetical protein
MTEMSPELTETKKLSTILLSNNSKKTINTPVNDNPGPGAYKTQADVLFRKPPMPIMGSSHRPDPTKLINDTPGPCMYLPKLESVKKKGVKWTITAHSRMEKSIERINDSPGPGSYEAFKYVNSSEKRGQPNTFIAGRYQEAETFVTPSPLEYQPSVDPVRKRGPKFSMGTQP